MDTKLKDRVVLVTGSSFGVGEKIASAFVGEGARVISNGRHVPSRSVGCAFEQADITDPGSVRAMFESIARNFGHLDVLVNNAGGLETFGTMEGLTDEDWQRTFDLNCLGAMRCSRAGVPLLAQSDQPRIVNIASMSAISVGRFNHHYGAAKAALKHLGKSLSITCAPHGILVNTVCPSTLDEGEWHQNIADRAKREGISLEEAETLTRKEESAKSPLGRIGTAEDLASLVVFLASGVNQFITGQCICVDGGGSRSV